MSVFQGENFNGPSALFIEDPAFFNETRQQRNCCQGLGEGQWNRILEETKKAFSRIKVRPGRWFHWAEVFDPTDRKPAKIHGLADHLNGVTSSGKGKGDDGKGKGFDDGKGWGKDKDGGKDKGWGKDDGKGWGKDKDGGKGKDFGKDGGKDGKGFGKDGGKDGKGFGKDDGKGFGKDGGKDKDKGKSKPY